MESKYTGIINKGDLISISFNSMHWLGFYIGKGSGDSYQYYSINRLNYWLDKIKDNPNKKMYKDFIWGNTACQRFIKISPDMLEGQAKLDYERAMEVLGKLHVI